jgi:hypothetical protein
LSKEFLNLPINFFLTARSISKRKLFSSNQSGMVAGMGDLGTAILVLLVLFFLIPFIGHLLGIILGLVGTFTRTKKRLFGIIGLFLNVFPFILLFVLYLIGNS